LKGSVFAQRLGAGEIRSLPPKVGEPTAIELADDVDAGVPRIDGVEPRRPIILLE